ncbi:2-hydroxyacid dehydrogenase [Salinisphaera sp.]|uniref:2-hydroxyacid dehydrogenase n=1 Tax=Salinisphaera sp. TaxID=1914330 RepID=UPI000C451FF0|nr:2-hydroxyacid dehydrogenase [Salinisphaera sp.]MBS64039.1 glycerate dehydrogenase [Salinisphaera sp.]
MRGCFLDVGSMGDGLDWDALTGAVDDWQCHHNTTREQVAERVAGADIVVTNKVVLDADTLENADKLKLVCVAATGFNNVDVDAAARCGIAVVNVTGYATPAVSQHVLALMLAHATRWASYDTAVKRGDWAASEFFCLLDYPIEELAGQTLGLIGHGELGQAVGRLAEAFGMSVLVGERPGATSIRDGRVAVDELLERSDMISLHCPLTDDTRHLIDADALARMKNTAFLVNTARGAIVDSAALIAALKDGEIGGAALDVLDQEPPPADHPLLDPAIPNLIVTPHSAWGSRGARQRMLEGVTANIQAFLDGEIRNRVN